MWSSSSVRLTLWNINKSDRKVTVRMDILKWKGKFSLSTLQDKKLQANINPRKRTLLGGTILLAVCPIQSGKPWKYIHKTMETDSNVYIYMHIHIFAYKYIYINETIIKHRVSSWELRNSWKISEVWEQGRVWRRNERRVIQLYLNLKE